MTEAPVLTIPAAAEPDLEFSVCTLVADREKYARLLQSFAARGFDPSNTEFLALDNTAGNVHDGYTGIRRALPLVRGRHILYTHDDIELVRDGLPELRAILARLDALDPRWMIAGNAGMPIAGSPDGRCLRCISDPHGEHRDVTEPTRVTSLDENFLVLRRDRIVLPSIGLSGFHLFATDMCLQAELAGGRAYVIPFLLRHHSGGRIDDAFRAATAAFARHYDPIFPGRIVRTPSGPIALGASGRSRMRRDHVLARARWHLGRVLGGTEGRDGRARGS